MAEGHVIFFVSALNGLCESIDDIKKNHKERVPENPGVTGDCNLIIK